MKGLLSEKTQTDLDEEALKYEKMDDEMESVI
jgi:hypothetical protein